MLNDTLTIIKAYPSGSFKFINEVIVYMQNLKYHTLAQALEFPATLALETEL